MQVERVDVEAVRPLRQRVLRPHQREEEVGFPGDEAPDTMHVAARAGKEVVGVATVLREPHARRPDDADWRIRGMAVSEQMRRRGIGMRLLACCEAHAKASGGRRLWCNARLGARAFYERMGFAAEGEAFVLPDIGAHLLMSKPL